MNEMVCILGNKGDMILTCTKLPLKLGHPYNQSINHPLVCTLYWLANVYVQLTTVIYVCWT